MKSYDDDELHCFDCMLCCIESGLFDDVVEKNVKVKLDEEILLPS